MSSLKPGGKRSTKTPAFSLFGILCFSWCALCALTLPSLWSVLRKEKEEGMRK